MNLFSLKLLSNKQVNLSWAILDNYKLFMIIVIKTIYLDLAYARLYLSWKCEEIAWPQ